jgi:hypothetical protein
MSNTQLPAHLLALFNSNPELATVGENVHNEAHPKIRYGGKKWKFIPASGDEILVKPFWLRDANGQVVGTEPVNALDVIIVDINEHKSHVVYENSYVEGEEAPPVWSSDDGTPVPVEHQNKVVSDYRRVAVISADTGITGVYELRISSGSITNFDRYITALKNAGAKIPGLVTRITFDDAKDYPKLVFAPVSYIDEAQANALKKVANTEVAQTKLAIGQGQKAQKALAAPATVAALPAPAVAIQGGVIIAEGQEAVKKTRTRKAVETQAAPAVVLPMASPSATATPAAAVITKPAGTNPELSALLQNIMKG